MNPGSPRTIIEWTSEDDEDRLYRVIVTKYNGMAVQTMILPKHRLPTEDDWYDVSDTEECCELLFEAILILEKQRNERSIQP